MAALEYPDGQGADDVPGGEHDVTDDVVRRTPNLMVKKTEILKVIKLSHLLAAQITQTLPSHL